jgi:8-oxo-dGTP diphosphatase
MMSAKPLSDIEKVRSSTAEELDGHCVYVVGIAIFRRTSTASSSHAWQLLVVRRADTELTFPNKWELPGGHVEEGETIYEALRRETIEETGLVVQDVVGQFEELRWTSRTGEKESVQFNFVATIQQPYKVTLNAEEHSDWKWVEEDDINSLPTSLAMDKVLRDAIRFSKSYMEVL